MHRLHRLHTDCTRTYTRAYIRAHAGRPKTTVQSVQLTQVYDIIENTTAQRPILLCILRTVTLPSVQFWRLLVTDMQNDRSKMKHSLFFQFHTIV